jgi:hypothetical protein
MFGIVDLSDTPRVDTSTDTLSVNVDFFFRTDYGKWHERLK